MHVPLPNESSAPHPCGQGRASLEVLSWQGSDAQIAEWVREGQPGAAAKLFDRCGAEINRLVLRVLGGDPEHDDLVHDIFLKVWSELEKGRLRNPEALSAWVAAITINTLYKELRKRYVRRRFFHWDEPPPEALSHVPDADSRELLQLVYRLLKELAPDERLAFSLRHLDQRKLVDVASLCGCSLATVKRRLARAEARFVAMSSRYPEFPRLSAILSARTEDA